MKIPKDSMWISLFKVKLEWIFVDSPSWQLFVVRLKLISSLMKLGFFGRNVVTLWLCVQKQSNVSVGLHPFWAEFFCSIWGKKYEPIFFSGTGSWGLKKQWFFKLSLPFDTVLVWKLKNTPKMEKIQIKQKTFRSKKIYKLSRGEICMANFRPPCNIYDQQCSCKPLS